MKIIVGLGNPGKEYQNTRHNFGWLVVEELALLWNGRFSPSRFEAETYLRTDENRKILLVKPLTLMNLSGESVVKVLRFYKRKPDSLLVVHDDLDLPLGRFKFSEGGSSAGHRGIDSLIETLATPNFSRLRLGIGRPRVKGGGADYVLTPFEADERPLVDQVAKQAAEAVGFYVVHGMADAMNRYHISNATE